MSPSPYRQETSLSGAVTPMYSPFCCLISGDVWMDQRMLSVRCSPYRSTCFHVEVMPCRSAYHICTVQSFSLNIYARQKSRKNMILNSHIRTALVRVFINQEMQIWFELIWLLLLELELENMTGIQFISLSFYPSMSPTLRLLQLTSM